MDNPKEKKKEDTGNGKHWISLFGELYLEKATDLLYYEVQNG
jgi:hypothetical protein